MEIETPSEAFSDSPDNSTIFDKSDQITGITALKYLNCANLRKTALQAET